MVKMCRKSGGGTLDDVVDSVNTGVRTRAIAGLEECVAAKSLSKSAVMKFYLDGGENAFVKRVHGGMKDACNPRESEHLSSRERARVIPARQPG